MRIAEIERPWDGEDSREWLVVDLYGEQNAKYVSIGVDYLRPGDTERRHYHDSGVCIDLVNIDAVVDALRAGQTGSVTRE